MTHLCLQTLIEHFGSHGALAAAVSAVPPLPSEPRAISYDGVQRWFLRGRLPAQWLRRLAVASSISGLAISEAELLPLSRGGDTSYQRQPESFNCFNNFCRR
jgi:hypothetical protein